MGNLSLNISNSTIACQPANIIIKNEKFQKIIQKLYFMVDFYKAQNRLEKNKSPVKIEVVESDVSSIEDNSSLENNIPKRFDLENFLNNDDDDDDESFVSYKPPLNLTFPAINDEVELYMKLLLAQVTSRNHSVENSSVYKIYDEYKNMIKPKVIYKKSLELALNALNYFK